MERRFYPELEALRGLAALSVLALHANLIFGPAGFQSDQSIRQIFVLALFPGNSAVVLFFVLSGFVLSQTIPTRPREALKHVPGYVLRRLFRLIPAMWIAIAFSALVVFAMGQTVDWHAALRAFIFEDIKLDPPLWTLKPEFYVSILILPLLAVLTPIARPTGNIILVAALAWYYPAYWVDVMPFVYMFYLGCLVPTIGRWVVDRLRGATAIIVYSVAGLIFAFASPAQEFLGPSSFAELMAAAVLPSFLFVSYFATRQSGPLFGLMRSRPLRFLGCISYSLYLLHWPLRSVLVGLIHPKAPHILVGWPFGMQMLFAILLTVATTLLATLVYYSIELPFIRMGRRLTNSRREPAVPLTPIVSAHGRESPAALKLAAGTNANAADPGPP